MSMFTDANAPPTLSRLIALIGAGYRIDEAASKSVGDTVWLEHPAGRRAPEKTLHVGEDGWVFGMALGDSKEQLRIGPDQVDEFRRFIANVPKPTWWERNNGPFYVVWAWVIIGTAMFALVKLFDFIWDAIFGK